MLTVYDLIGVFSQKTLSDVALVSGITPQRLVWTA